MADNKKYHLSQVFIPSPTTKRMALATAFQPCFDASTQAQGRDYVKNRQTKILQIPTHTFHVAIKDLYRYAVALHLKQEDKTYIIHATCNCFSFHEKIFCPHLWAALLVADTTRWLTQLNACATKSWKLMWNGIVTDAQTEQALSQALPSTAVPTTHPQIAPQNIQWKKAFTNEMVVPIEAPIKHKKIEILYGLATPKNKYDTFTLHFFKRDKKQDGRLGNPREWRLTHRNMDALESVEDKNILTFFDLDANRPYVTLTPNLTRVLLPHLLATKRLFRYITYENLLCLSDIYQGSFGPWQTDFCLTENSAYNGSYYSVNGHMTSAHEKIALVKADHVEIGFFMVKNNIIMTGHMAADEEQFIHYLVSHEPLMIPQDEVMVFAEQLASTSFFSKVQLPEQCTWNKQAIVPEIVIALQQPLHISDPHIPVQLHFQYPTQRLTRASSTSMWFNKEEKIIYQRCIKTEQEAWDFFTQISHLTGAESFEEYDALLPAKKLSLLASHIHSKGWRMEADGHKVKPPGEFQAFVSSGIDWFELQVDCQYGNQTVSLPKLLQALKAGRSYILLDDGSAGLLPEEWLQKYAGMTNFAQTKKDRLKFCSTQAVFIDSLLTDIPHVDFDEKFATIRSHIKNFTGIKAKTPSSGFTGTLRPYQQEGLGWFDFLRQLGFGGCLADDMGLGKTIQVLAMLHDRKKALSDSPTKTTSLIVVPRSLIHNWQEEAKKFCSKLTFYDYSTPDRLRNVKPWNMYDVMITTYAIMRSDIAELRKFTFDYVILDEAQMIKNNKSLVTRASCLLQCTHRLAMSGTPVENHLGELASIFEFLNPGMLNKQVVNTYFTREASLKAEQVAMLAKALRPFILRRTKEEVLSDLPPKSEHVLYCELGPGQRKHYDDLKAFYRDSLATTIKKNGLQRSKIQVLEALLRLRQAACHIGLIDKNKVKESSAKLDVLLEQIKEVLGMKHKALVFSQFTSMLAIVRDKLEAHGIAYEYLDGKTRNRKACVDRFQNNSEVRVFLISLKAGGLGLNLTEADYCFILDPWWNPAAEAQAIDRAHRMGQQKKVFAYKLIAKNTVEEKIMALQAQKKELFKTIVSPENSMIRNMNLDDLQHLLS